MKKIILVVAAFAAVFASACKKEEVKVVEEGGITFISEKPSFTNETKTAWTGTGITWKSGDAIRVGTYGSNGQWYSNSDGVKFYQSTSLAADTYVASFLVSTAMSVSAPDTYYGIYPHTAATTNNAVGDMPNIPVTIPNTQIPAANSFYSGADLMVGVATEVDAKTYSMGWTRLVAHAPITFKGLGLGNDETIESISFIAQDGANIVGDYNLDVLNGTLSAVDASNEVVVKGTNLVIDGNGNVTAWFTFVPFTLTSLKVIVTTNEYIYTRDDFDALNLIFKGNARNTLAIDMSNADIDEVIKISYIINEEFDNSKGVSDENTAISSSTFSNFNGTCTNAYYGKEGSIRLGTSTKVGSITSKRLDLSKDFVVEFDSALYGSDSASNMSITVGSTTLTANITSTSFGTYKVEFPAATSTSTIKIGTSRASKGRLYLDNVKVYYKSAN